MVIVGVGLIGGSLGLALKRTGFTGRRVGVSRPETVAQALELDVVDEGWGYEELDRAKSAGAPTPGPSLPMSAVPSVVS